MGGDTSNVETPAALQIHQDAAGAQKVRALLLLYIFDDYWCCYCSAGTVVYSVNSQREAEQECAMMVATSDNLK